MVECSLPRWVLAGFLLPPSPSPSSPTSFSSSSYSSLSASCSSSRTGSGMPRRYRSLSAARAPYRKGAERLAATVPLRSLACVRVVFACGRHASAGFMCRSRDECRVHLRSPDECRVHLPLPGQVHDPPLQANKSSRPGLAKTASK